MLGWLWVGWFIVIAIDLCILQTNIENISINIYFLKKRSIAQDQIEEYTQVAYVATGFPKNKKWSETYV